MKSLFLLTVLAPMILSIATVGSASAATSSTIAVSPGYIKSIPPTIFTIAITFGPVTDMVGYDVVLNYNSTVLKALHVGNGNWSGSTTPFVLANDTIAATGTIHVSEVILGTTISFLNSSLFKVTFQFQGFGKSPLTISNALITGLVNGVVTTLPPPTVVNGLAVTPPPASARFIKGGVKPDFHHLSITRNGNVQTLFANVENTGTTPAIVRVDYTIASAAGTVFLVSTVASTIPVGGTAIVAVSYTVPSLPIRYFVFASLKVSGDGNFFVDSGSSDTLSYAVVL